MIRFEEIEIGYSKPLLFIPSLTLDAGKVYALVGLNGIGKSTFLNSITGQTSLLSGKLFLNQQELQKISKVNLPKLIAYVDSSFVGVEYLTVFDYLALGRSPHTNNMGKLNTEDKQVIQEVVRELNLVHLIEKDTSEISDGERQLCAVARAIIQSTPIILLDEPTAFLDYLNRQKLIELLVLIAEKQQKTIILSSHDIDICINNALEFLIVSEKKILKNGDIINIDVTVIKDGWYGDTSKMYTVGDVAPHAQRLIDISQECLYKAIDMVKPGIRLGDIGHVIQTHAEANYYSVVRDYCGHGIGMEFHEEPQVLHYGKPDTGLVLEEGMTFTIEPMVNAGKYSTKIKSDGWTVETRDGRLSSQWEHTMVVTSNGVEVLTARNEEPYKKK